MDKINIKCVLPNDSRCSLTKCFIHSGGSIALTHPLGMSEYFLVISRIVCEHILNFAKAGARQVVTGLAQLRRQNGQILCTSMCIGSGMGSAGIFMNEA